MADNSPIIKLRDFGVSTAIFEWNKDDKTSYSVSLQRSFKKKDDKDYTNETINMYPEDLLKIANLLVNTYNALNQYTSSKKSSKQTSAPAQSSVVNDDIPF